MQHDRDPLLGTQHDDSFSVPLKPRPQDDANDHRDLDDNNHASGSRTSDDDQDDEQRRLLDGQNADDDNNRQPEPFDVEESHEPIHSSKWDNPMWRYPLLAVFFGMFLLMFKVVLIIVMHSEMRERGPDRVLFNGTEYFGPTVILISLDGFRNDYLFRNVTPNLAHFAANGMRAEYMHPAFPSITFPNHWTMATGLHPESHGIVANEFYDPILKKEFSITDDDKRWWNGEPIWMTAKRQEKESAVIMWPGSMITGLKPGRVIPFNDTTSPREKIDLALEWVDLPRDDRPNLISVYIQQVDEDGHRHGPTGPDIDKTIANMDDAIGYLWQELDIRNLIGRIHVVIVSDHGMAETDRSRVIYYDDILSKQSLGWLAEREAGPLLGLRPKPNAPKHAVKQIYQELYDYTQNHPDAHFQVYLREDVPARLHYSNNERIAPIVAIPDVGYVMVDHERWHPKSPKEQYSPHGIHGYDNLAPEMRSIFMAHGPTVDMEYGRHAVLAPFYNTEVYGFVCELLNIDSGPHNGTMNGQFVRIR